MSATTKPTPTPDYDALAEWAESDDPTIPPRTKMVRRTPDGHAALREMLEAGAQPTEEKEMLARAGRGRRSLDPRAAPGTTSPMWRVRAPGYRRGPRPRARAEGRYFPRLVRDAVRAHLAAS